MSFHLHSLELQFPKDRKASLNQNSCSMALEGQKGTACCPICLEKSNFAEEGG